MNQLQSPNTRTARLELIRRLALLKGMVAMAPLAVLAPKRADITDEAAHLPAVVSHHSDLENWPFERA